MNDKLKHFLARTRAHIGRVKRNVRVLVASGFPVDGEAILAQVATHDDSKFLPPERETYIELTWMYRCRRLGEPFEMTDELKQRIAIATLHHITHNPHHPEYWAPSAHINMEDRDAPPKEMVDGTGMSDIGLVEMCCDWVAMSQENLEHNSAHVWADANVNVRWKFTTEQVARIYQTLDALQEVLDRVTESTTR